MSTAYWVLSYFGIGLCGSLLTVLLAEQRVNDDDAATDWYLTMLFWPVFVVGFLALVVLLGPGTLRNYVVKAKRERRHR